MTISSDELRLLKSATRVGTITKFRFPGARDSRKYVGEAVDEVALLRDRYKVVIQKVKYPQHHLWDDAECGYRLGYFMISSSYAEPSRVVWRNYAMLITESELDFLLRQAEQKGWRIPRVF